MTEEEYILATNRTKITIALDCLRFVLAGDDNSIDKDKFDKVISTLSNIQDKSFKLFSVEPDD